MGKKNKEKPEWERRYEEKYWWWKPSPADGKYTDNSWRWMMDKLIKLWTRQSD